MRNARGFVLAVAATLTMAVSYFDRQVLAALAPSVKEALHISNQRYGWTVSAFSIAYLVATPLAGRLIDAMGARRGLLYAFAAWTVVAALHALVPSFGILFALRIALGVAEAPSFPGAAQAVQRALPPESRPRGFGLLFTGSSLGALVAPVAAVAIEHRYGFRVAFLVTAVAGLLWLPMWLVLTNDEHTRRLLGPHFEHRGPISGSIAHAVEGLLATLLNPSVLRASVVVVASAPLASFVFNWTSSYLHDVHGIAQEDMGHYLWLPPLFFDAGALLFGFLASAHRVRHTTPPRALLFAAALISTAMIGVLRSNVPWMTVTLFGVGLMGTGGLFAILTSDMLSRVDHGVVSSASGITAAAQSVAYLIANPLIGAARDASGGYRGSIVVLSFAALPGALIWILWKPKR